MHEELGARHGDCGQLGCFSLANTGVRDRAKGRYVEMKGYVSRLMERYEDFILI